MPARANALPCRDREEGRMGAARVSAPPHRARRAGLAACAALALAAAAPAARADDHDPERAAHPVRIAAYVLHPVGVILDYLIVRPAHWVVEREPFRTLFGHED
jgi:hypothetical protein